MARDPAARRLIPLLTRPWFLILSGLALDALAWLLATSLPGTPAVVRLLLILAGTVASLAGVALRLRRAGWELLDRIETAAMVAVTGIAALVAFFAMNRDWESGRMLFGAVFLVSLAGVVLVLLPPLGRRVALSLFILFHFGGMLTAVTSVDPPGSAGPWVSKQLWAWVYRPYLSFLYMTNAYHFYSPDPGPPALMWFAVQYKDGSHTWIKLPERANSPIGMHYQRLLALPEHTYSPLPRTPFTNAELAVLRAQNKDFQPPPRGSWEDIVMRRELGSTRMYPLTIQENGKTVEKALPIPMVYGMADALQYREPNDTSKMLIGSVAKRIFWTAPRSDSGAEVRSVKVYRVVHQILSPAELARGVDPLEKTKHWGYFLGEYDEQGKLVDSMEPFLYWYIPIVNVPADYPNNIQVGALGAPQVRFGEAPAKGGFVLDGVEMHAAGEVRRKGSKEGK